MIRFRNCSFLFESTITKCPVHSVHKYPVRTLVTQPADNSGAWRDLYHWVSHSVIHIQVLNVTKCHIKASLFVLLRSQDILQYSLNRSVRQNWNCFETQASLWPTRTVSFWKLWEDVEEINSEFISLHKTENEAGPGDYVGGMPAKQHCLLDYYSWKKKPAQQHSGPTHLIERLNKWAVHSPAQLWFGGAQEWVWRPSAEWCLIDFCQDKSLECCARIP